jgi:hypothetical protein
MKSTPVLVKVIEASIRSDCADDFDHARIEISRGFARHILHLAAVVRRERVSYIHDYDYLPDFLKEDDEENLNDVDVSVDCEELVVSSDDFWWEGMLKNCDTHWSTDRIYLEELRVALMPDRELPKHVNRKWKTPDAKEIFLKRLSTPTKKHQDSC